MSSLTNTSTNAPFSSGANVPTNTPADMLVPCVAPAESRGSAANTSRQRPTNTPERARPTLSPPFKGGESWWVAPRNVPKTRASEEKNMSRNIIIETVVSGNTVRFRRDGRPGPLHFVHIADMRRIADELHDAADVIEERMERGRAA